MKSFGIEVLLKLARVKTPYVAGGYRIVNKKIKEAIERYHIKFIIPKKRRVP